MGVGREGKVWCIFLGNYSSSIMYNRDEKLRPNCFAFFVTGYPSILC